MIHASSQPKYGDSQTELLQKIAQSLFLIFSNTPAPSTPIDYTPLITQISKSVGIAGDAFAGSASITNVYAALGAAVCNNILLTNNTGVTLDIRYGSSGAAIQLFDKGSLTLPTNGNASNLQIKRNTGSDAVTIGYIILP